MPQPTAPVKLENAAKIIFVRQQFSAFGGAELILDRTLQALAARGCKVALLGRSWREDRQSIQFIRCNPPKLARPWRETLFARAACQTLRHYPNSLVQAHERIPCCDIFRAGDGVHAAYLQQRRRGETTTGKLTLAASLFHHNTLKLERTMFASPRLQAVIVNSEMVVDDLARHYDFPRARIRLVPNGIDLQRFSLEVRAQHRATTRKQLGIALRAPLALFVGSGYERKGLARAIQASARAGDDIHLVVIGRDRRPAAFQALAKRAGLGERFHLVGPMADPVPYYAAADALILPTIYDPFPSTVIEALACGLPVVTTTGCGARDIVRRLDPALAVDAFDSGGMTHGLRRAFELAARPSTANAARTIAEPFDIETMVQRMLSVYEEFMPGSCKS